MSASDVVGLEVAVCAVAAGVDDTLGDALVVEVEDLLPEVEVLEQRRTALAGSQRVLVIGDRHALLGGQPRTRRRPRPGAFHRRLRRISRLRPALARRGRSLGRRLTRLRGRCLGGRGRPRCSRLFGYSPCSLRAWSVYVDGCTAYPDGDVANTESHHQRKLGGRTLIRHARAPCLSCWLDGGVFDERLDDPLFGRILLTFGLFALLFHFDTGCLARQTSDPTPAPTMTGRRCRRRYGSSRSRPRPGS